jgi:hypothetical protein
MSNAYSSPTAVRTAVSAVLALATIAPASALADMDILYINRCVGGCTITPGFDDAINHRSSLVSGTSTIPQFPFADSVFDATVTCIRSVFAPYDVYVTPADPGPVVRRELILAGQPSHIGFPNGVGGVAPWQMGTPINNVIAFAFAASLGADPDLLCWIGAQQIGTLYGLDHAYYCPDVMSYLSCGLKTFTDFDAQCGESAVRPCDTSPPRATQNSAEILAVNPGRAEVVFRNGFEAGPSPRPRDADPR